MEVRELIGSEIVETISEYIIVKTKERMLDVNGKPYCRIQVLYDICLNNGDGDIVASYDNIKSARKWAKENKNVLHIFKIY